VQDFLVLARLKEINHYIRDRNGRRQTNTEEHTMHAKQRIEQFRKDAMDQVRGWDLNSKASEMGRVPPTFFRRLNDETLYIDAERGDCLLDYYGEFRGYVPYIHSKLEELAEQYGLLLEWENPGAVGVYDNAP